ncbi:bax inhibitor 1 [Alligator mississippiensis]|uniref:Transmembrane BAX inhibitor motif-containing protein 6 n=1 Tax=Alligator mississippiensis TaxID=8496 RepID=A0A151MUD2_ALLMI|nr:bax inhibitor 1 [Alligator mississippiensis]
MFVAAAGAYVNVVTHLVQLSLLTGLGSLGLMIWLLSTPHSAETEQKRLGMLAGFAFLTGVNLGPLLEMCIAINPSILPTAFLGTAVIFTCFTLSALYARRRSYLYLGGFLFSGLSLMFLFSLVNLFVGSTWLFTANLYVGLMVMCGFVLFDTQLIIEKAESGDKDYIWHCVDLFLDFVNIFRELMIILGMNEGCCNQQAGDKGWVCVAPSASLVPHESLSCPASAQPAALQRETCTQCQGEEGGAAALAGGTGASSPQNQCQEQ